MKVKYYLCHIQKINLHYVYFQLYVNFIDLFESIDTFLNYKYLKILNDHRYNVHGIQHEIKFLIENRFIIYLFIIKIIIYVIMKYYIYLIFNLINHKNILIM